LVFIGLTGGIGTGKSEALRACERLGAAVLSTDAVVHELLGTDELRRLLSERWGERVLADGDVDVDRGAVAEIVFERPQELSWLESVLFPRVGERVASWRAGLERLEQGPELAVVEVPLLFEAGIEDIFDATVAIVSDEETRARRTGERDHRGIGGRQARQLSSEEKARRADYVVHNDGTLEDLERRMKEVLEAMSGSAAR
jgi:dephospho-CoA kinase